ncbi:hypothetical protein MB2181_03295 [Methylophilales bacterium HTCC2181]|uniref:Uncharacterized protein n=1 Tax=Methylophilales bacterium HTCC2181 TaxID=383631 RepID=A0P6A6_9PROT|nr:hypothetical protein MB2181_03295 [Methylophilales bacterium HTCC2181]
MKKILALLILIMTAQTVLAGAAPAEITYSHKESTDTRAYAGLVWTLGKDFKKTPELTLGLSAIKQESGLAFTENWIGNSPVNQPSESVEGGLDWSLRINFDNGVAVDSTRLLYLNGDRDLLGNIGLGYSFAENRPFGTIGVQAPYSRIGVDVALDNGTLTTPEFFVELLTLDKEDRLIGDYSCDGNGGLCGLPQAKPL